MATIRMKKMRLIGLIEEKQSLLAHLDKLRCVELVKVENVDSTIYKSADTTAKEELVSKLTRLNNAIDIIELGIKERVSYAKSVKDKKYKAPPKGFMQAKAEVAASTFYAIANEENELFNVKVTSLEGLNAQLTDISAQIANASNPALVEERKNLTLRTEELSVLLEDAAESFDELMVELKTSATRIEEITGLIDSIPVLIEKRVGILDSIVAHHTDSLKLKMLYDFLGIELQKVELDAKMCFTDTVFVLDGWVPEGKVESTAKAIEALSSNVELNFYEPENSDFIPTLNKNNNFVKPFEMITNMFSAPSAREIDPNPFISFWYTFLFGIMLADLGYGIILAVACFALLKLKKPNGGGKSLITIIMWGGVSTAFWGWVFGGCFGDLIVIKPLLVSPLEDPLVVLGFSLAVGVIHILCGMGIRMVQQIKDGHALWGIMDTIPWYIFFGGIALMVLPILNPALTTGNAGMIMMVVALALVLLTAGHNTLDADGNVVRKSIFSRAMGGLGGLYKIVGFLGDILSYARLFGLMLSGGVVAMVFNKLGGLISEGAIYLFPISLVIYAIGHIFNIAINTLGTYVHTSRLQYIEFFSRFYTGEGRIFEAFGEKTKYISIIN